MKILFLLTSLSLAPLVALSPLSSAQELTLPGQDDFLQAPPIHGTIVIPEEDEQFRDIFDQPDIADTPLWEKLASLRLSLGGSVLFGKGSGSDTSLLGEVAYEHFFWPLLGVSAFVDVKPYGAGFFIPPSWLWDFGVEVQYYLLESIFVGGTVGTGMIIFASQPEFHFFTGPVAGWDYRLNETQSAGLSIDGRFRFLETSFYDINIKAQYRFWF